MYLSGTTTCTSRLRQQEAVCRATAAALCFWLCATNIHHAHLMTPALVVLFLVDCVCHMRCGCCWLFATANHVADAYARTCCFCRSLRMWLTLCPRVPSCQLFATAARVADKHACTCCFQVVAHVADAVSKGAKLLVGGSVPQLPEPLSGGNFYSPTVLAEATIAM
jgi:hypothetical protein